MKKRILHPYKKFDETNDSCACNSIRKLSKFCFKIMSAYDLELVDFDNAELAGTLELRRKQG